MSDCRHFLARPGSTSCPSCGAVLVAPPAPAPTLAPPPVTYRQRVLHDMATEAQEHARVTMYTSPEHLPAREDEQPNYSNRADNLPDRDDQESLAAADNDQETLDEAESDQEPPPPWAGRAERAYRHLSWFVRESWAVLEQGGIELEWNWHIEAICNHIQWIFQDWIRAKRNPKVLRVRMQNAFFSLPPGCLKTRIIMECAPAWMWLRDPSWTVRCLSVNPAKALESADKMRQLVTSSWYQEWFEPDWEMREDQDAKGNFGNTRGGARYSAGITAKIVGSRTDALLVDDPNDPMSDEEQCAKINALWDSTLGSRVNDRRISVCIVVQQRIHVDDLTGHVAKKRGWSGLVLPLLFDPERRCKTLYGWYDPRTAANECIQPDRYTPEVVAYMREEEYGARMFEAQCQQNPSAADGDIFKAIWWRRFRLSTQAERDPVLRGGEYNHDPALVVDVDRRTGELDVDTVCVTVDATGGSKADDASHVGLLICATKGQKMRLVLDDLGQGPRSFPEMKTDLDVAIPRASNLTGKLHIHVLIEKKALGPALSSEIEQRIKGEVYTNSAGEPIAVTVEDYEPANTQASKVARAQAMEVPMALGEIYIPEDAPWLQSFLAEFQRFPKKPNDKVDALAQFVDKYRQRVSWVSVMQAVGR